MIFKKCPNCEFENPETAKFCNECGARLTPGESARSPQEQPPPEATGAAPVETTPVESPPGEPAPVEPTPPESVPAPAEASSEPAEPQSVAPPAAPVLLEPAPAPKELLAPPQETPLLAAVEALVTEKDQITAPEAAPSPAPESAEPPSAEAAPEPASPPESTEIAAAAPSEPAIQLLEVSDPLVLEPKAAPQEQPVEAPAAGHPFGQRFKIVEELGTGTLGTVYRVTDKAMEREMALKSIKPEISHKAEVFEGFGRELKVERGLIHKNIARIFELIPGPGSPFITMEYVAGRDLKSILKEKKRLPVAEVLPIAKQLFSGLAEAHKAGTLHLDLRPDNIIMDKEGTVKIMDLGILRLFRSKGVIRTVSGMPQYMSPEQIEGRDADARSDIFAAGAILYEMLTGSLPPVGTAPRNPRELNPEIPRELSLLILRCLEPEKDKRNATAREIRAELEKIESAAAQTAAGPALSPEPTKSSEPGKAAEAAAQERATAEQAAQSVQPWTKTRRRGVFRRTSRSFIPTLAILGVVLLAVVLWQVVLKPSKKEPALPPTPTLLSLAVLPFEDASVSKERRPLGVAIAETMTRALHTVDNLFVPAAASSSAFLGKARDSRQVGRGLNVDHYLEGTFEAAGDKIKIDVRLLRADSGAELWSGQYDRTSSELPAVQEEIIRTVLKTIGAGGPSESSASFPLKSPANFEAYDLDAQGRFLFRKGSRENLEKAVDLFSRASAKDPGNARAFEGLAEAHIKLAYGYYWASGKAFLKAKDAALKALLADPGLAEAHTALGRIKMSYEWDFAGAEKEYREALRLDPANADAHQSYALLLSALGRHGEAQKEIQAAQEQNPLSSDVNAQAALILYFGRLYEQAESEFKKALAADPLYPGTHFGAALVHIQMGKFDEALGALRQAKELGQNAMDVDLRRAYIHARLGQRQDAGRILTEALNAGRTGNISQLALALVYAGLAEKDQAIACLENAVIDRDPALILMRVHPFLDSVRGDIRFVSLLQKIGLGPY
jgi:serine/threonine-protein kinase